MIRTELQAQGMAVFGQLRGVGPGIAGKLRELGVESVVELAAADPDALYDRLCRLRGCHIDRCVCYVFRCAVYQAAVEAPDAARCDWWTWKDPDEAVG